jgi:hypothetical protein
VHFAGPAGSVVGLSVASAQKFGNAPFGEHASLLSKAKLGAPKARSLKSSIRARIPISGCWHDRSPRGRATGSRSAMAAGRRRARHARLPWLPSSDSGLVMSSRLVATNSLSLTLDLHCATDQDLSALAAIRSTERGVMQVGLMRVRRGSPHLTSPCDGAHFGYFATQPVWRYAASLAGSAAICRSAYYWLYATCGKYGHQQ